MKYIRKPYEEQLQEKLITEIKLKYGHKAWVFKTHDMCRVGIPDLIICFYGHFVAIELKKPYRHKKFESTINAPNTPTNTAAGMQKYNIKRIVNAHGSAFVGSECRDIMDRLDKIRGYICDTLQTHHYAVPQDIYDQ